MTISTKKIFIDTITEYHQLANLSKPKHQLLSVIKFEDLNWKPEEQTISMVRNFYIVALKKNINTNFKYGQHGMDFEKGIMHFMSPKQVLTIESPVDEITNYGWQLLIHPDFLLNTTLSKKIKQYEYFNYRFNQALPLSIEEEETVVHIINNIYLEQDKTADHNSHEIIIAQIELLLAYTERFYKGRDSKEIKNESALLDRLELLIDECLSNNSLSMAGIPSVEYISDQLHISANYLSRLLQKITGRSTKHYLQDKLIELAQEKLSATELSVSEIAYELGFNSSQSFSRLFKMKTNQTPTEFRQSFL
ncbi:AraC family transcriptional regulator [Pedobacter sp. L105]|uniref:helix-turn-helix domain-containing protein n=1 Tax=Pedobacter sp. L105 TaxID=1641871 RepID=UPI00131D61D5|nr:AraC family transcriptional regulator [Pedobacter sp. L105]